MVQDTLHGILFADGTIQIESNDHGLRIALSRVCATDEGKNVDVFRSTYWVKDGLEWERVETSANYPNVEDFLDALRTSSDFALAVKEIELQRDERAGG